MEVQIGVAGVDDRHAVEEYITRKLGSALDRFAERIESIDLRLEDQSRNSAAFDGLCRVDARLLPRGRVHAVATGSSPHETAATAIQKLAVLIRQEVETHRHSSQIRHQQVKRRPLRETETELD